MRKLMDAILCHMVKGVSVQNYHIEKKIIQIGRSVNCDIFLDDQAVSATHAFIEKITTEDASAAYRIRDLESTNHTYVNNKIINSKILENNDQIRIGFTILKFVNDDSVDVNSTVKIKKSWIPGVYYSSES
jgi:pSer/pThr/pTyr-binding forkhead associated (FHA) protein